jgi:predicted permease
LGLSLKRAAAVSPGFQADRVLSGQISLVGSNYPSPASGLAFTQRLVDKLDQQPGVVAAGTVNNVPFSGHNGKSAAHIKGYVLSPGESPRGIYSYGVAGDYFAAMGFRLQTGRFLDAHDSRRSDRVCVVDEDFARYYWPHESALGHRLWQGSDAGPDNEAFTVVGVVKSAKQAGLTEQSGLGAVYYPYIYRPDSKMFVVVRAAGSPALLKLTLEKVVRQIDTELAVDDILGMDTRIEHSLLVRRSPALLAGLFSAVALLLTAIGIYGVLSFAVSQRRREIGVRMALGAQPGQIQRQFLAVAGKLLLSGAALGVLGAGLMGRAMRMLLFQVSYLDLPTLAACGGVVTMVSLAACLWPARRAARISPVVALADQ